MDYFCLRQQPVNQVYLCSKVNNNGIMVYYVFHNCFWYKMQFIKHLANQKSEVTLHWFSLAIQKQWLSYYSSLGFYT